MLRRHQNQQADYELVECLSSVGVSPVIHHRRNSDFGQEGGVSTDGDTEIIDEDLKDDFSQNIQLFEGSTKLQLGDDPLSIDSSYVRFAKTDTVSSTHDYCYPSLQSTFARKENQPDVLRGQQPRVISLSANLSFTSNRQLKVNSSVAVVKSASGWSNGHRRRCIYCGERFEEGGRRSVCADAPDDVLTCINVVTCSCVADAVAYHCLANEDGDYEPMCVCSPSSARSTARCAILVLLSFILPCLCCFWPLMGCRRCAIGCGCCINGHKAV